jgi:hypothetical protein
VDEFEFEEVSLDELALDLSLRENMASNGMEELEDGVDGRRRLE